MIKLRFISYTQPNITTICAFKSKVHFTTELGIRLIISLNNVEIKSQASDECDRFDVLSTPSHLFR